MSGATTRIDIRALDAAVAVLVLEGDVLEVNAGIDNTQNDTCSIVLGGDALCCGSRR